MKRLLLIFLLLAGAARATIINAASRSAADIQTAINTAVSNDSVVVPAGTVTWNTGEAISIPSTKGIILDGTGVTVTRGTGTTTLVQVETNATVSTRITGFTWNESATPGFTMQISTSGGSAASFTNAKFRLDHMVFSNANTNLSDIFIRIYFNYGLIDNCTFTADDNSEMVQNHGYSGAGASGWTNVVTPGSTNSVYFEDCTFTKTDQTSASYDAVTAHNGFGGSRTVARHVTYTYCQIDVHGTAGQVGQRWFEFYSNSFVMPSGTHAQFSVMDIRAGSGVLFNQSRSGGTNSAQGYCQLREEDSGAYPELYQVGRGQNQALDPLYCWNNDFKTGPVSLSATYIQDGRDFYSNTARSGYLPYQYPYPGSYPVTAVVDPTGLLLTVTFPGTCTNGVNGGNGMALTASGGAVTATYSTGSGTAIYVYNLNRTVLLGETITLAYTQPGTGIQVPASGTFQTLTDVGSWPQSQGSGMFFPGFTVTNTSTGGVTAGVNTGKLRGALQ